LYDCVGTPTCDQASQRMILLILPKIYSIQFFHPTSLVRGAGLGGALSRLESSKAPPKENGSARLKKRDTTLTLCPL